MTAQGAGGTSTAGMLGGVDLKLGALMLRSLTTVVLDLSPVERRIGHPIPIILGSEVFDDCVVDIDFLQHRIAFRDPASFKVPLDAQSVAATADRGIHTILASVEGHSVTLQFDLGNGSPLSLYPSFWDRPDFMERRRTSTTEGGGFGGVNVRKLTMVRDLAVAGASLSRVPATLEGTQAEAARSGRLDGNVGIPIFRRFHLIVDFPHDRVLFAPPVDVTTPFHVDHTGLTLEPAADGLAVLYVAPDTPGARAGLKKGDQIISVDGLSLRAHRGDNTSRSEWKYGTPGKELVL